MEKKYYLFLKGEEDPFKNFQEKQETKTTIFLGTLAQSQFRTTKT